MDPWGTWHLEYVCHAQETRQKLALNVCPKAQYDKSLGSRQSVYRVMKRMWFLDPCFGKINAENRLQEGRLWGIKIRESFEDSLLYARNHNNFLPLLYLATTSFIFFMSRWNAAPSLKAFIFCFSIILVSHSKELELFVHNLIIIFITVCWKECVCVY